MSGSCRGLLVACVFTVLAGCKEKNADIPAVAVPSGYVMVDKAYGVRESGLTVSGSSVTAPIVEMRGGDAYALFPITSDCKGTFSRGAGTVFGRDGTVAQHLAAVPDAPSSGSPEYAAVLSKVCAVAKSMRSVPEPFSDSSALELLYGHLDSKGEADWASKDSDGQPVTYKVTARGGAEFTENGKRMRYFITGARNPQCDAHACGGAPIGIALFSFEGGKWVLESHQTELTIAGAFGDAPPALAIKAIGPASALPILGIESPCFGNGGYCDSPYEIDVYSGGSFHQSWAGLNSEDHLESGECGEGNLCTEVKYDIKFTGGSQIATPRLIIATKGRRWDTDKSVMFAIDERVIYRFDTSSGKYVEEKHDGQPTPIPTPSDTNKNAAATTSAPTTATP